MFLIAPAQFVLVSFPPLHPLVYSTGSLADRKTCSLDFVPKGSPNKTTIAMRSMVFIYGLTLMYCLLVLHPSCADGFRLHAPKVEAVTTTQPPVPQGKQLGVSGVRTCPVGQQLDKNNICRMVW